MILSLQNNDFHSTQILLSFGANINAVNYKRESALDILQNLRTSQDPSSTKDMWELLLSLDAESGTAVKPKHHIARRTTNIDRIKERINKPQTEGVPNCIIIMISVYCFHCPYRYSTYRFHQPSWHTSSK